MKSSRKDAVYLNLYHGRKTPDQKMEDWGTEGPTFKLNGFYTTYGCQLKLDVIDNQQEMLDFILVGDMILYDGVYYGDWYVSARLEKGQGITELDVTKMNK